MERPAWDDQFRETENERNERLRAKRLGKTKPACPGNEDKMATHGKVLKLDLVHRLLGIHAALDDALGDTDVEHMDDKELREAHPVQWAAAKVAELIYEMQYEPR